MNKYKMPEILDLAYNQKYSKVEVCESSIKTERNIKLRIITYNVHMCIIGSNLMKYVRENALTYAMYFNIGELKGCFI